MQQISLMCSKKNFIFFFILLSHILSQETSPLETRNELIFTELALSGSIHQNRFQNGVSFLSRFAYSCISARDKGFQLN